MLLSTTGKRKKKEDGKPKISAILYRSEEFINKLPCYFEDLGFMEFGDTGLRNFSTVLILSNNDSIRM
jgi:hypothetical protein